MKTLFIVLDGISDRPIDGRTPLKVANTPNMDAIARDGICGMMDAISPGIPPGSATAHLALLGYDPYKYYTGRGPFEAAGTGLDVKGGDIAFRCNFATIRDGIIVDRRAGRIRETAELEKALNEIDLGIEYQFKAGTSHRGALVLRGKGLSPNVTSNDPKKEGLPPKKIEPLAPDAKKTAKFASEFVEKAHKILSEHDVNKRREAEGKPPANYIIIRGAGVAPSIPSFHERYHIRGGAIAAACLIIGVAKLCGMDFIPVEGVTGGTDSNVSNKIKKAMEMIDSYDFILVNIKGADEAAHDGNFEEKTKFIERIDEAMGLIERRDDLLIVLTGDHSTPVSVKNHSGDPVPVAICGPGVRTDDVKSFDEFSCARGSLGRIRGLDLMPIILDLMDKSEKYGD